jgi:crossover junction endodeoxyribonuclease RusA
MGGVIQFCVPCEPVPKGRPRAGRGRHYTPKRTRDYERSVAMFARMAGAEPIVGPVRVEVSFWRSSKRRCDLDNLVKSVTDALNGLAYADDQQIVELVARKGLDRAHPRAVVAITALEAIND